jgi:hypothetical protein
MRQLARTLFGKHGSEWLYIITTNRYAHLQVGEVWFTVSLSVADYYGRMPTTMAFGIEVDETTWSPQVNITLPLR